MASEMETYRPLTLDQVIARLTELRQECGGDMPVSLCSELKDKKQKVYAYGLGPVAGAELVPVSALNLDGPTGVVTGKFLVLWSPFLTSVYGASNSAGAPKMMACG